RDFKDQLRDPVGVSAIFGQALMMTVVLGFVFFRLGTDDAGVQSRLGLMLFVVISLSYGVVMPFISVFPLACNLIRRERASGAYHPLAAYVAKFLSQAPALFVANFLMAATLYWMVGLKPTTEAFFEFVLVVIVQSHAALCLGFMIGSLTTNLQVAHMLATSILSFLLMFSGQFLNLDAVSWVFRWIQYISILTYNYKAIVQTDFIGLTFSCDQTTALCPHGPSYDGALIVQQYALGSPSKFVCVGISLALSVGFFVGGYFLFLKTSRPLFRLT
ncbi:ATP-binding cassette sub- G member 2, partial [Cladochytrium tenue]